MSVGASATNSAIVLLPMPLTTPTSALTTSWSFGELGQPADEVAVDLQITEGEVLEVLEGAEAGPEVIERDRTAERLHPRAKSLRPLHVRDRGGLGELDHELRGIHLVKRKRALDVAEHALVGDR